MADQAISTANLNAIENSLNRLASAAQAIDVKVSVVQNQQAELDGKVQSLTSILEAFIAADQRQKQVQLAETRIVKVRQQLETEYGHYADVRRRATGILQALDRGLVTHDTIQHTTEDVMMASPRYWLAPALVALAAWSRDDKELAQKALREALERDVDKTSLFYALVLRRQERRDAASRWLHQFFARQDPGLLGREFVVVLDAFANGAFGREARELVNGEILGWLERFSATAGFDALQEQRWREALLTRRPNPGAGEFPKLAMYCSAWPQLQGSLALARLHQQIINFLNGVYEGELAVPREITEHVDGLLDKLVTRFDDEELPLRRSESELQAIIDTDGDVVRAREIATDANQALEATVDFPSLLTSMSLRTTQSAATVGGQRLAIALSQHWLASAHDQITAEIRGAAPQTAPVAIEGWSATLGSTDEATLKASLSAHIEAETQAAIDKVKLPPAAIAAGIVGVLLLIFVLSAPVMLLGTVGCGIYAYLEYRKIPVRKQRIRDAGDARERAAVAELHAVIAELVDYRTAWRAADSRAEECHELIAKIEPGAHLLTTHEPRGVLA